MVTHIFNKLFIRKLFVRSARNCNEQSTIRGWFERKWLNWFGEDNEAFLKEVAVREGFEPSIHFRVYTLSRRAPSTTRTPHRVFNFSKYGGEGGIRTLDTFSRIHTFQACSFNHSDTSPYFVVTGILSVFVTATGRYYREKQCRRQQTCHDFFRLFD